MADIAAPRRTALPSARDGTDQATLIGAAVIFASLVTWASLPGSDLKYLLYGVPALLVMVNAMVNGGRVVVGRAGLFALALYLVIAGLAIGLNRETEFFTIRDTVIIAAYLSLFAIPFRARQWLAEGLLATLAVALAVQVSHDGYSSDFDLLGSQGFAESTLAFPLGALLIYFAYGRRWPQALVTAILCVLTYKRIAFAGIGLVLALEMLCLVFSGQVARRAIAIAAVVCLSIGALFLNEMFAFMAGYLNLESGNAVSLSLGRTSWATVLWTEHGVPPPLRDIFGFGPGAADRTLMRAGFEVTNPHNDWLKLLFDYGWFGLIGFHLALMAIFGGTRLGIALYVYTGVLFVTDNVLIYMDYFMCVALLCGLASYPDGRAEQ